MSTTDIRAAFEAWVKREYPNFLLDYAPLMGFYKGDDGERIGDMYDAWQAATEAAKATGTAGEPHRTVAEIDSDIATGGGLGRMDRLLKERARAEAARQPAPVLSDAKILAIANDNYGGRDLGGRRLFSDMNLLEFTRAILAATNRSQP